MLKIFSTQLTGYFKQIAEKEELNIEDGARLLAQALVGHGTIYIHGTKEMEAIVLEATMGEEPLTNTKPLFTEGKMANITPADRVLLFTRFSNDQVTIELAKKLQDEGVAVVGVSALQDAIDSLQQVVDVHIDTKLTKGLIPDEDGTRYGFPSIMTGLFAYYGVVFTIKEILADY
ncbi:DUF2529 domain-containing protein [Bacillus sp. 165]|uniref:DUF2529 domain-containing protein n=1 Tax=Bacillus sp. 165 TaxID=1529117 RepID=UPI001ADCEE33|nr:DUF2529 domain-containing protein [Bacillus sp. 165]